MDHIMTVYDNFYMIYLVHFIQDQEQSTLAKKIILNPIVNPQYLKINLYLLTFISGQYSDPKSARKTTRK